MKVLGNTTPYEQLTGQKPNLAGVPEWGQRVWVHSDSGTKLDGRASEARWVGYDEDSTHAHRIYWPDTHKVSVERNIRFTAQSVTVSVPTSQSSQPAMPSTQNQKPASCTSSLCVSLMAMVLLVPKFPSVPASLLLRNTLSGPLL